MIYKLGATFSSRRPQIDFETTADLGGADWDTVNQILRGKLPIDRFPEIQLVTDSKDASSWHCYANPGTLDLISEEAARVIGPEALRLFHRLPLLVDGIDFCLLHPREHLDCFDRDNARFTTFPNSANIMSMDQVAFKTERIQDPMLFTIAEHSIVLYATESVRKAITRSRLLGFRFERAPSPEP